ncbi:MAG: hypothetical protein JJT75_11160 [Opitutales bacterium]|nr:hypothetical protein [Opitutales bacterium]MCH8541505.1 hypothetical protein [Opitutales bacterium]
MKIFVSCTLSSRNLRFFLGVFLSTWSLSLVPSGASAEDSNAPLPQQLDESLEGMYAAAEWGLREIPRETFSVLARQRSLGTDPEVLRDWVQQEIRLIPYEGVLRKGSGALHDRMGNSLDRALLLYEMLGLAGWETRRLAKIDLSAEESRRLAQLSAEQIFLFPQGVAVGEAEADEDLWGSLAEMLGRPPEELLYFLEKTRFEEEEKGERLRASIGQQTNDLVEQLTGTLSEGGIRDEGESLAEHWWVEYQNEAGSWVALDPLPGNHSVGETFFGRPAEDTHRLKALPKDLFHRLEIRLVAERWDEGNLTTETVFAETFPVRSQPGQALEVSIFPKNWGNWSLQATAGEIKEKALAQEEWLPVWQSDGEPQIEASILRDGTLNQNPLEDPRQRSMREAASALGRIGMGGRSGNGEEASFLTAVWVDLTVLGPGVEEDRFRRYFVDLVGPQQRAQGLPEDFSLTPDQELERALGLMARKTIYLQGHWLRPEWIQEQSLRQLVESRTIHQAIVEAAWEGNEELLEASFAQEVRRPIQLYQIGGARWQYHPEGMVTFPWGLNVIARDQALGPRAKSSGLVVRDQIDFIRMDVTPLPGLAKPGVVLFQQGVVDTHVEHEGREGKGARMERANAAAQFGMDSLLDVEWVKIAHKDDLAVLGQKFSADAIFRWEERLERGRVLLIRSEPLYLEGRESDQPLWWEWNPENHHILGYGGAGYGQSLTEYFTLANKTLSIAGSIIGAVECALEGGSNERFACCLFQHVAVSSIGTMLGGLLGHGSLALSQIDQFIGAVAFEAGASGLDLCSGL